MDSPCIKQTACKVLNKFQHGKCLVPYPVKVIYTDPSEAMLLLWTIFNIYVSYLSCFLVCSLPPCGHLLEKG